MKINIKLFPNGKLPQKGTVGAACYDFYAAEDAVIDETPTKVRLGVGMAIPEGYALLVLPRSSMGLKTRLRMTNSVGVIDSDYRGEICALYASTKYPHHVSIGDRIAQGMIVKSENVEFVIGELGETDRGSNGFGSTGI